MKKLITKKELQDIQKYWWQVGGFGGELSSGIRYYSQTYSHSRIGYLSLYSLGDNDFPIEFYENDALEELEQRINEFLTKCGFKFDKDFNLITKYYYDGELALTYDELKKDWEVYANDADFCDYGTNDFDDYLYELLNDMEANFCEIDYAEYLEYESKGECYYQKNNK